MRFLFLAILVSVGFSVAGQQVKGRVWELMNGKKHPIPGANVYWSGTTEGSATDENGHFTIAWNEVGRLVVSFIGYQSDTLNVTTAQKHVEVVLRPGQELEGVTILKRGATTIMSTRGPLIEQVITGEELCKAACCNLGESFTTNASVDVSYADAVTGAKQIQLLGLTGKYVQMMTENIPNFRGVSSLYGLSYIPGPWMDAISVSKGAGSVINGYEAIAGQISVDYKKPLKEKFFVNVFGSDEGMLEVNMNGGVKLSERWSTALLVHGDWFDKAHDANHDGFLDMPKKTQYNVMNRWAYKDDTWFLQFGGKLLDESRLGGQHGFRKGDERGPEKLYGISIDTRRYEGFLKLGYLMPQYENTSMALLVNYTGHDQRSFYGVKDYDVKQQTVYLNYIYQSVFGDDDNHKYSAGLTFNYDNYDEFFKDYIFMQEGAVNRAASFDRVEKVGGAFFQYTGHFADKFTAMAGLRYDYHSLHGGFWTPRLHLAYSPNEMTMLKVSAGMGYRTANVLAENSYLLATGRSVTVDGVHLVDNPDVLSELGMEKAWNFGVQLNRKFLVAGRVMNINLDYYRTDFMNQIVVDNESDERVVNFYELDGKSYSNCYQVEVKYELIPRFDVTAAYRFNDVKVTMGDRLLRAPLQSKYKGLLNLSYYTNMRKWQFDFTTQFNGGGRLPELVGDDGIDRRKDSFKAYQIMNAQVSKFFRRWSVYGGCENIGDFTQKHPIVYAESPFDSRFDSSRIWGPIHGRKFYVGVRFGLDRD